MEGEDTSNIFPSLLIFYTSLVACGKRDDNGHDTTV